MTGVQSTRILVLAIYPNQHRLAELTRWHALSPGGQYRSSITATPSPPPQETGPGRSRPAPVAQSDVGKASSVNGV